MLSSLSSSSLSKPKKRSTSNSAGNNHNHHRSSFTSHLLCCHSPSATATLDLLILILVLFSGSFLLTSYFSYIFNSLSILLPPLVLSHSSILLQSPLLYLLGFFLLIALVAVGFEFFFGFRSRKCDNPKCRGLKKAMEFDLKLQTEDCLKSGPTEIDRLPWKGDTETNPDYECLRAELRKMAPPNGRAVLLFRARCGCPTAKLVGWGPKRGRRHKRALASVAHNRGDRC
ncbi:hypothetical protein Nepgr_031113 [Nepenthes gracilis]|uniref:Ribosomal protein L34e superfamily protein n=1 Tax=Nepenthes gracilis TaxID=150966 RepID=A0AAD3TFX1_NEPGR|nr:hypothetical protein Nepgr_031113 [Nepenthes gracilis]